LALLLLLMIPLEDTRPGSTQAAYDHARNLFQRGDLTKSQQEAERGAKLFQVSNPELAAKFQLLEAESMFFRGLYPDTLRFLDTYHPNSSNPEGVVRKLTLEALALARQQQPSTAVVKLAEAESICRGSVYLACGEVLRARGILTGMGGNSAAARPYYLATLAFARAHHDRWSEAGTFINLGFSALQVEHYDEALDWFSAAHGDAMELGAENQVQAAAGNMGWAYYQLGDGERALEQFLEAERSAVRLGNVRNGLKWTSDAGYVYRDRGDFAHAIQSYNQALDLAKQIGSKEDIVNAIEDLAQISVVAGKLDEANAYILQVIAMESAGGNRLSANLVLTQGELAAARHQDQQAEARFREVQNDKVSPTTLRLGAGNELAGLLEREGNSKGAERIYKTTLAAFESARAQVKNEDLRLPFASNATRIYDHYIHFLVEHDRGDEALAIADQSRARTLEQGLGMAAGNTSHRAAALNPRQIAKATGATLLFYWLGHDQSYLWVITPAKVKLIPLPAQQEIVARVERYRKVLLAVKDPLETGDEDGQALYKLLVAPASTLFRPNTPVMILTDGALSQLNFETLLAPGPNPRPDSQNSDTDLNIHYWIEDATLLTAPSLAMLAEAKPVRDTERSLLLLGSPVSPSEDYPSLPFFGFEMTRIQRHFAASHTAVFAGKQATPSAYLSSNPTRYSYIHFVSHAVASRTDPLDSAIILSGAKANEDDFKLYARDIMKRPIDARLVTISACNGSGTRSYAGEGLVGLSWAFLRAGAHSVIGALWEVSDDSTPRLMDALYQGIEDGQSPAAALRQAKLALLHSQTKFRVPFYWAPFQVYTRQ
jgi:CHAT domain-containing protein/Flp pilus assembly protein TadD